MRMLALIEYFTSPLAEAHRNAALLLAAVLTTFVLLGRHRKDIVEGWKLVQGIVDGIIHFCEHTLHRLHDDLAPEARRHPRLGSIALAILSATLYIYAVLVPSYSLAVTYVVFRAPIDPFPFSVGLFLIFVFVGSLAMAGYMKREARWARLKSNEWWATAQRASG